jgi:hypothetical protein
LNDEFMLVSRRGRSVSPELRERLLALLHPKEKTSGLSRLRKGKIHD